MPSYGPVGPHPSTATPPKSKDLDTGELGFLMVSEATRRVKVPVIIMINKPPQALTRHQMISYSKIQRPI